LNVSTLAIASSALSGWHGATVCTTAVTGVLRYAFKRKSVEVVGCERMISWSDACYGNVPNNSRGLALAQPARDRDMAAAAPADHRRGVASHESGVNVRVNPVVACDSRIGLGRRMLGVALVHELDRRTSGRTLQRARYLAR
jgi:hypothetical protein